MTETDKRRRVRVPCEICGELRVAWLRPARGGERLPPAQEIVLDGQSYRRPLGFWCSACRADQRAHRYEQEARRWRDQAPKLRAKLRLSASEADGQGVMAMDTQLSQERATKRTTIARPSADEGQRAP